MIFCSVDGSGAVVSTAGFDIGQIRESDLVPGRYCIVFGPESVGWRRTGEQQVDLVGRSALYWFVRAPENEKLIGPKTDFRPRAFYLNGTIVAFRDGEATGVRALVLSKDKSNVEE